MVADLAFEQGVRNFEPPYTSPVLQENCTEDGDRLADHFVGVSANVLKAAKGAQEWLGTGVDISEFCDIPFESA